MSPAPRPRGLYLITPDEPVTSRLLQRVGPLLGAGVAWLQYRNKAASAALRQEQAAALQALCARAGVPLLVNDDAALASEIGAAGAHLGEDDGALAAARALLGPHAILGASCYDSLQLAREAVAAGASYVAFGAFFPTTTKVVTRRATPDLLRDAAALGVPRVAIGGITPENGRALVEAGADLLAVIGGVFDAPDPLAAVRAYQRCFQATPAA
ncbi:thiamine phosphate synthase [Pseudoxanthomonas sp. SGNA-20]|jgi:thiamine-phosphate pyrophosphorylase|uniref:Thiamine-phosphate synthase n=1 Tax=Pseudoxanthomonas taiwanensis J19 TaxID=935569 RepID=A0A562CYY1_9GAMM|nr:MULTISPECIES: thiamine phosphate synthase [Pseudoxanthomonas]RRN54580.1 thiamine phosphate synthase [Pseudoxanthomonas sp. SGNA-20]RRN79317.1 thiamine phosphate synthase [Pseudoxanthomonas sp. SGD-10]TWH02454.1 thiamine-phosphate pyrophosphorylase [Pseudoxanthomonas taiwanensis J19]